MADTFGKHGFKASFKWTDYLQELVTHGAEAYNSHPLSARPLDLLTGDDSVLRCSGAAAPGRDERPAKTASRPDVSHTMR